MDTESTHTGEASSPEDGRRPAEIRESDRDGAELWDPFKDKDMRLFISPVIIPTLQLKVFSNSDSKLNLQKEFFSHSFSKMSLADELY